MEPLLCIFLAMSLGFLLGSLGTLHLLRKEKKELSKELDKFRELYFNKLDDWANKYTNEGEETRTGGLHSDYKYGQSKKQRQ